MRGAAVLGSSQLSKSGITDLEMVEVNGRTVVFFVARPPLDHNRFVASLPPDALAVEVTSLGRGADGRADAAALRALAAVTPEWCRSLAQELSRRLGAGVEIDAVPSPAPGSRVASASTSPL